MERYGRWLSGASVLAVLLLAGCSLTPGKSMTLFPEGHRLIDSAKAMRAAATEPLPLPRELDKRLLPPYIVEPGDVLLVQPANLDSPVRLPADQPVLQDGTINLGRYGHVVVAGKTVPEIEPEVRAVVEKTTKDAGPILVRLITRVNKIYYVLGEVNAPGSFPLQGRETVLDGIIAAGGLTDRASRRNIILVRPTAPDSCRAVLPICYNEIVQLGDTSTNYQLAPGDRIYVPSRTCMEELQRNKPECPPCGRPQVPCVGSTTCIQPAGTIAPVTIGKPVAPVRITPVPIAPTPTVEAKKLPPTLGGPVLLDGFSVP
jgi:protein involved in polysaccharide export with SLBB domain